jgi:hypothetical protein
MNLILKHGTQILNWNFTENVIQDLEVSGIIKYWSSING